MSTVNPSFSSSSAQSCFHQEDANCHYAIIEHREYLRFITLSIPSAEALDNLSKDIVLAAWTRNSWHILLDMKTALIGKNPQILQRLVKAVVQPRYLSLGLKLAVTLSLKDAALLKAENQAHGHRFFTLEKLAHSWLSSN